MVFKVVSPEGQRECVWTELGGLDEICATDILCLAEEDRMGPTLPGGRHCPPGNKLWAPYSQSLSFPPVSGGFCFLGLVWGLNKVVMLDMEEAVSTW